ncbi:MAG: citrate synthase [Vulcanimicrobiaceae bacterium]
MTSSSSQATGATVVDRGLEGVVVGSTALCSVEGAIGRLTYRGYDVAQLAAEATFEEVCYLLIFGRLPTEHQLADLAVRLAANRSLPQPILAWLAAMPADARPMDVLRTAISGLAMFAPRRDDDDTRPSTPRSAIDLIAKMPTIVAAWDRIRRGLRPIDPLPHLSTAANFLYMRTGKMPADEAERALDAYLIVHADHSYTASTFAARVTASTRAGIYAGATSALATLEGDLHGGAPGNVMEMLVAIAEPAAADAYVRAAVARGERIAGMGDREYEVRDPRATVLEGVARTLAETTEVRWFPVARALESAVETVSRAGDPAQRVYANVELYAAPVLQALGIPADEFACLFACGRIAGWTAHVLEQLADNRLIRPQATYRGPRAVDWSPIAQRREPSAADRGR